MPVRVVVALVALAALQELAPVGGVASLAPLPVDASPKKSGAATSSSAAQRQSDASSFFVNNVGGFAALQQAVESAVATVSISADEIRFSHQLELGSVVRRLFFSSRPRPVSKRACTMSSRGTRRVTVHLTPNVCVCAAFAAGPARRCPCGPTLARRSRAAARRGSSCCATTRRSRSAASASRSAAASQGAPPPAARRATAARSGF